MSDLAFLNGALIPAHQLTVAVYDAGFVQGVTIAEQMRTFHGELFRLDEHLRRLQNSLEIVGIDNVEVQSLSDVARELAAHNHRELPAGHDLGLSLFVTPGPYAAFAPAEASGHTVAMHTYPIPFRYWADKYQEGQRLVVPSIRQVPSICWPAELKCRSRMHYYLADREAQRREPGSRALLLDQEGFVMEASTANLLIYRQDEGLVSPPNEKILPGVSVATLYELGVGLGLPFHHRQLRLQEVQSADEVLLCSTSPCVLPVSSVDGVAINGGAPGPIFQQLITAWGKLVGVDIIAQAQHFRIWR